MIAEAFDWTTEGHAGGAYGKVIRWAFEKQGLYQARPSKSPVKKGRRAAARRRLHRGWPARRISLSAAVTGIAGRFGIAAPPTAARAHQEPVAGTTNFAYVKIKNRGRTTASGVTVKAFHHKPSAGQIYPGDWKPMTTAELRRAAMFRPIPLPKSRSVRSHGAPSDKHDCMIMVAAAPG